MRKLALSIIAPGIPLPACRRALVSKDFDGGQGSHAGGDGPGR